MREIIHKWTPTPVCPKCGSEDADWWDGPMFKSDGDTDVYECDCGCTYEAVMSISVEFNTKELLP